MVFVISSDLNLHPFLRYSYSIMFSWSSTIWTSPSIYRVELRGFITSRPIYSSVCISVNSFHGKVGGNHRRCISSSCFLRELATKSEMYMVSPCLQKPIL
jgi:hypothetical protein